MTDDLSAAEMRFNWACEVVLLSMVIVERTVSILLASSRDTIESMSE